MQTVKFDHLEKVLKADGWVKQYDANRRSIHNPRVVCYEKEIPGRKLDLQLWGDGGHRVTFWQHGCACTLPTDFRTEAEMAEAIAFESARLDGYQRT